MAFNNRYRDSEKAAGLNVTDIPGLRHNPYIFKEERKLDSRSNSPVRTQPGKSEYFEHDIVRSNEAKIKQQIVFSNNVGFLGPFLDIDKQHPAPKSPSITMASSAYKMEFSPGKYREEMPKKLQNNQTMISKVPLMSPQKSMRHMSNGEAFNKSGANGLSSSQDFSSSKGLKPMGILNPKVQKARQIMYDKGSDEFRIKKNLTSNADRILTSQGAAGYSGYTPQTNISSKYEEIRKAASNNFGGGYSTDRNQGSYNTYDASQENMNYNNIQKYGGIEKSSTFKQKQADPSMANKSLIKNPTGNYNTLEIKKTLGMSPTAKTSIGYSHSVNAEMPRSTQKITQASSVASFNDPNYHRVKNFNNYGYDVLTGVRKESPNRLL